MKTRDTTSPLEIRFVMNTRGFFEQWGHIVDMGLVCTIVECGIVSFSGGAVECQEV